MVCIFKITFLPLNKTTKCENNFSFVNILESISFVSKTIPIGITYASFAGLAIIATVIVGVIKFNQVPNLYSVIGLVLIITGVLMVNILGNS